MAENKNAKTPADGPVAWGCQCGKLYTVTCISSKPAKQWVWLTDEEILAATNTVHGFGVIKQRDMNFARAIEAKLKEKNQ